MHIQILKKRTTQHNVASKSAATATRSAQQNCTKPKKNIFATIAIFMTLAILSVTGCKYGLEEAFYRTNGVNERSANLTTVTLPSSMTTSTVYQSGHYNFMILTDIHYGADYDVPSQKILNWIDTFNATSTTQAQKPLFCIILGDIVDTGNREDYAAFNTFQGKLESKGVNTYCIVGNHDLLNSGWNYWKYSCKPGTSFYRFQTNGISWYFTDTGSGTMGDKQLAALETAFASDSNRKLVFSHYPLYGGDAGIFLWSIGNAKERARLIDLYAENNVKYVFAGHCHSGAIYDFGNFKEYVAKTTKSGKAYLVSIDETTTGSTNPITNVQEIDLNSF